MSPKRTNLAREFRHEDEGAEEQNETGTRSYREEELRIKAELEPCKDRSEFEVFKKKSSPPTSSMQSGPKKSTSNVTRLRNSRKS